MTLQEYGKSQEAVLRQWEGGGEAHTLHRPDAWKRSGVKRIAVEPERLHPIPIGDERG